MWVVTARLNSDDDKDALCAAARALGIELEVRELRQPEEDVILADVIAAGPAHDGALEKLAAANLVTLADVTRLTFEQFWQAVQPRGFLVVDQVVEIMVDYGANFLDARVATLAAYPMTLNQIKIAYSPLFDSGISSLTQLSYLTKEALLDIHGFGAASLKEVRAVLRDRDLYLKGEAPLQ